MKSLGPLKSGPAICAAFVLLAALSCSRKEQAEGTSAPSDAGSTAAGRQQPAPPAQTPPQDGVRRVTVEQLKEALAKGEAVAVDVRGSVPYEQGHIRGAVSVPLGLIAQRAGELPKGKLIVTYCA